MTQVVTDQAGQRVAVMLFAEFESMSLRSQIRGGHKDGKASTIHGQLGVDRVVVVDMPTAAIRKPPGVKTDPAIVEEFARAAYLEDVSPRGIFADFLVIDSSDLEERIANHFTANGCKAIFADHPQLGRVLVGFVDRDKTTSWKWEHLPRAVEDDPATKGRKGTRSNGR